MEPAKAFPVSTIYVLAVLLFSIAFQSVSGFQEDSSDDSDDFSDFTDFNQAFEDMDKSDKFHDRLGEGFENWEQRCLKTAGQKALDEWLDAQQNLLYCVMENFDSERIKNEVEEKKETGDLDLVFKKYCGAPIKRTLPCIRDFLEVSRRCLKSKDKTGLNITLGMIDAAINFACHGNGDRLALFMAYDGVTCVEEHRDDIVNCINQTVPEIFEDEDIKNVDLIVFDYDNCRKGDAIRICIEQNLMKCEDPTPSNIINAMLLAMRKATPCQQVSSRWYSSAATSPSSRGPSYAIAAALTVAALFAVGRNHAA